MAASRNAAISADVDLANLLWVIMSLLRVEFRLWRLAWVGITVCSDLLDVRDLTSVGLDFVDFEEVFGDY
jgi:hypothetical protein